MGRNDCGRPFKKALPKKLGITIFRHRPPYRRIASPVCRKEPSRIAIGLFVAHFVRRQSLSTGAVYLAREFCIPKARESAFRATNSDQTSDAQPTVDHTGAVADFNPGVLLVGIDRVFAGEPTHVTLAKHGSLTVAAMNVPGILTCQSAHCMSATNDTDITTRPNSTLMGVCSYEPTDMSFCGNRCIALTPAYRAIIPSR